MEYQATRSPGQDKAPPSQQGNEQGVGCNKEFLKTVPAVLKIVEMVSFFLPYINS